jgi:hypothetical protein
LILVLSVCSTGAAGGTQDNKEERRDRSSLSAAEIQDRAIVALESAADDIRDVKSLAAQVELAEQLVAALARKRPEQCTRLLDAVFDRCLDERSLTIKRGAGNERALEDLDRQVQRLIASAATVDRKLAEAYIARYTTAYQRDADAAAASLALSPLHGQLALDLLGEDVALARSFAQESLSGGVTPRTIAFLEQLHRSSPQLAGDFFKAAVASVQQRGALDVNELFLLYAFAFQAPYAPFVTPGALAIRQLPSSGSAGEAGIDPTLKRWFVAASLQPILAQQRAYDTVGGKVAFGSEGDWYYLAIIQPTAQALAPELVGTLQEGLNLALSRIDADKREGLHQGVARWRQFEVGAQRTEPSTAQTTEQVLAHADTLAEPGLRDRYLFTAATRAVKGREPEQALTIVGKLSSNVRDEATAYIEFAIAESAARAGQLELAERAVRREADPVRRAYVLTLLADALSESSAPDFARAAGLLGEAEQLAAKLFFGPDRVAILAGTSAVFQRFDRSRSAEALREAIRVANKVEGFSGSTRVTRSLVIAGFGYSYEIYGDSYSLLDSVARQDVQQLPSTLADVEALKNPEARVRATIALCRAALTTKQSRADSANR